MLLPVRTGPYILYISHRIYGSYFDFIMDLSSRYTNKLKTDNLPDQTLNEYVSNAQSSITRQQDIEQEKQLEFEEFRRDYVSQEASRIILEEEG